MLWGSGYCRAPVYYINNGSVITGGSGGSSGGSRATAGRWSTAAAMRACIPDLNPTPRRWIEPAHHHFNATNRAQLAAVPALTRRLPLRLVQLFRFVRIIFSQRVGWSIELRWLLRWRRWRHGAHGTTG
jgi:hypothetical protein